MRAKLSVLIPAYNPGKWFRGVMDQLKAQIEKYPDTEILVVDDGSTEDISWVAEYPNTTYIRQENAGVAEARNLLLEKAKGKYVQFLDADDEIYPNCLDLIYENIAEGYDYITYEFDTDHNRLRSYHNHGQLLYNCALWGYTFKRTITKGQRFDSSKTPECDVDWLLRVLKPDAKMKHEDRLFYNYRWDGNVNSLSHRRLRGEI